ncbi:MAG: hypothetical protein KC978_24465, partial [Candidatus Omnitrophica bacterium]|nr:hypothetical protein [Candidatus Omnitrophota bacterium]
DGAVLEHVVCGAMIGIAQLNDPETIGMFGKKMADPSPAIREIAAQTIINWKGGDVDSMLKKRYEEATGTEQAALLRVLAQREVPGVDKILRNAINSENEATKITALGLLGDSPDADLENVFLENARNEDPSVAKAAREGYLKLADRVLAKGHAKHALGMYLQALEFIYDDETLRKALTGIAGLGDPTSVDKVKDLIDRGIVPQDAARTYLSLAEAYAKAGDKDKQVAMIMDIIDHPNVGEVKNVALDQFKALGNDSSIFTKRQGFINEWHLIGPFPNQNGEAFHKAYFPEGKVDLKSGGEFNGQKMEWKDVTTEAIPARISMSEYFDQNQFVTAYAYTELNAPKEMEVQLMFGTNDGCEFWV